MSRKSSVSLRYLDRSVKMKFLGLFVLLISICAAVLQANAVPGLFDLFDGVADSFQPKGASFRDFLKKTTGTRLTLANF